MGIPGHGHPLYPSGPPASGAVTALTVVIAVIMSVTPVCVYFWKTRGCPAPRMPDRARRRYRRDMRHLKSRAPCACCGGVNTRLRNTHGQWICKNRNLCRAAMIYESMLDEV